MAACFVLDEWVQVCFVLHADVLSLYLFEIPRAGSLFSYGMGLTPVSSNAEKADVSTVPTPQMQLQLQAWPITPYGLQRCTAANLLGFHPFMYLFDFSCIS